MSLNRAAVEEISSQRSEPTWLREARLKAWQSFEAQPLPNSDRDEDWRRTDISKLNLDAFSASANGHSTPTLSLAEIVDSAGSKSLADGVIFCTLDEAIRKYPDLVREHLAEADGKFGALNAALWAGGAFVYVPANVKVEVPLQATYGDGAGGVALTPRTLVIVDRGASLIYVDRFVSSAASAQDSPEALSSAFAQVVVKEGGRLQYVNLQERGQRTWHFATQRASVARDATVDVVVGGLGSYLSKSYVETVLEGPGAEANLVGLVLTDGVQHIDHQTTQDHLAPHTTSNLLLKSALKGHSQSIFLGLVRMPKQAQQSDAFQEARALLLSEGAKADAVPKLEIIADDVRCTHAGAIGEIDTEQKFYLETRGIPADEAERLIVAGFFEPALERIPVEGVRDSLRATLLERLATTNG